MKWFLVKIINDFNFYQTFSINWTLTEWKVEQRELGSVLLYTDLEDVATDINVNVPGEGHLHVRVVRAAGDGRTAGLYHTVRLLLQVVRQACHITGGL